MYEVGGTYNILDAIPYWPETGQAQTTCKASIVALFAVVTFRTTRAFSGGPGYMAGIIVRSRLAHEYLLRREDGLEGFKLLGSMV